MTKKKSDITIISAWIEKGKEVWCRSIVAGIEAEWKVAVVGHIDPNGVMTTQENLQQIYQSLQEKIKQTHN